MKNANTLDKNGRTLDKDVFIRLAKAGNNCKEIAKIMGYHPNWFGVAMKKVLGMYPSVYITRMKRGET